MVGGLGIVVIDGGMEGLTGKLLGAGELIAGVST